MQYVVVWLWLKLIPGLLYKNKSTENRYIYYRWLWFVDILRRVPVSITWHTRLMSLVVDQSKSLYITVQYKFCLLKFQSPITPPIFDEMSWKINQVISSSTEIITLNWKFLARIVFAISCSQNFLFWFSKGNNSKKRRKSGNNKNMGQLFFQEKSICKISKP